MLQNPLITHCDLYFSGMLKRRLGRAGLRVLRAVKLLVYYIFFKSLGLQGGALGLGWVLWSPSLADPCLGAFPVHILGQTLSVHSHLVWSRALLAQAQDHCKGDTAFPVLQFGSLRTCGIAQCVLHRLGKVWLTNPQPCAAVFQNLLWPWFTSL